MNPFFCHHHILDGSPAPGPQAGQAEFLADCCQLAQAAEQPTPPSPQEEGPDMASLGLQLEGCDWAPGGAGLLVKSSQEKFTTNSLAENRNSDW